MNEKKKYTIMCCDSWCRVEGLPEYSELLKALKLVSGDLESVVQSEFQTHSDDRPIDDYHSYKMAIKLISESEEQS